MRRQNVVYEHRYLLPLLYNDDFEFKIKIRLTLTNKHNYITVSYTYSSLIFFFVFFKVDFAVGFREQNKKSLLEHISTE